MQADALQSTTLRVALKLFLTSDHITPATGKTLAITISKNGAAFGNPSAGATNATEIASGWYYVDLSTTDTATLGPLVVLGTASACDPCDQAYQVVKATNRGMTALPDTAVSTNGSLITSGTGTDQLSVAAGLASVKLTQTLSAARALDAIADTSLTLNDAMHCAIASAAGKKDASGGTSYIVSTPSTGTVLRTYTVTLITPPATVPDKIA